MTPEAIRERIDDGDTRVRSLMSRASNPPTAAEQTYIQQAREEVQHWRDRLARGEGDARARVMINELMPAGTSPRRGNGLGAAFINSDTFAWLQRLRGRLPVGA